MRRLLAVVVVLAAGCSLPLPHDVKTVGTLKSGTTQPEDLKVVPPDPTPHQPAADVVSGFLDAQADSDGRHAIARKFLSTSEATGWDDSSQIEVYDPETLNVPAATDIGPLDATVTISVTVIGQVLGNGQYVVGRRRVSETYALHRRTTKDDWRLTDVPDGLRLTTADLLRGFQGLNAYYLSPKVADSHIAHLVPDRVFLAQGGGLPKALVARLLQQPTAALDGAVTTGLPAGVELGVSSVSASPSGVLTVDLTGPAGALDADQRQDLAARLIWTLRQLGPGFTRLRLLAAGQPLRVPGSPALIDAGAFDGYDPNGPYVDPPYFFVQDRRLRSSAILNRQATALTAGRPGDPGFIGVDQVAVTLDRTQVAVLEVRKNGRTEVHVGPLQGATFPVVATDRDLTSPSWGSGELGLWLVRAGRDVLLVNPASRRTQLVPIAGRPAGELTSLAVSRDGARLALVIGGQLFVAPVIVVDGALRLGQPTMVSVQLGGVRQAVWSSSTELLVLVGGDSRQVFRVPVDGSTSPAFLPTGITPTRIAAAGAVSSDATPSVVLQDANGQLYATPVGSVSLAKGTDVVFPG